MLLGRRADADRGMTTSLKGASRAAPPANPAADAAAVRGDADKMLQRRRGIWASFAAIVLTASAAGILLHRPASKVQAAMIDAAGTKWAMQSDGRLLEYATCGRPGGMPVYWAHGYGQSATFLPRYACELAERENLYLISISMPGWGLSDSLPLGYKRSLLDWPQDVNVVLAKEGIDDVFLMGTSTGCVHAASFAHAFPNRVLGVMLNTPTAPPAAVDLHEISPVTALGKWLIGKRYIGDLLAGLVSSAPAEVRTLAGPDVFAAVRKMKRVGGKHGEIVADLMDDFNRATVHTYRGWTDTMHTIVGDVPFDLADLGTLTQRGIRFWVTTTPDDTTNPPSMQRWWRDGVPGADLLEFEAGWGHLHAFPPSNLENIFSLIASVAAQ